MADTGPVSLPVPEKPGSGLDLEDLRAFLTVVRTGSFRSAARELFTSQPTISRAVARLERGLGVELLHRGAHGVVTTAHGEALIPAARRVLAAATDLRRDVAALGSGTMQLGATATSARTVLAPFLSRWIPGHPEITVTALEDSERQLHARLAHGDCDLAIVSSPLSPSLEAMRITTARVIALFPPGHPMSGTEPLDVRQLADQPLLVNGPGFPSTGLLLRSLEQAGVSPRLVYQCSAGQTLAAMAEAGLGVAVFGDTTDLRGFTLSHRPLVDPAGKVLTFDLYVAWVRDAVPAWMRDFAVELAAFCAQRSDTRRA